MGILNSMARVTQARAEVAIAREQTVQPAAALIAKGYEYPLTVLGIAAGSGVLMSSIKVNPLAVPGVSGLVAGGTADIISKVISMAAGSFLGDFAGDAADATADAADEVA
jgi:hypothetical protein